MATEAKAPTSKKPHGKRADSKSAAIRAIFKRKPDAGPTAVVAILKRQGMEASTALVSNVKATMLKKQSASANTRNGAATKRRGRPGRKAAAGDSVSISQLVEARKFAEQVGGLEQAVGLLQSLAKLQ